MIEKSLVISSAYYPHRQRHCQPITALEAIFYGVHAEKDAKS